MNIGVVGLGLIGGSAAKAIKEKTTHSVYGADISEPVLLKAKLMEAIDGELTPEILPECDMVIIALYPGATVDYVKSNAARFKKGGIVVDCCGIKRQICQELFPLAREAGFTFIGGHPMAGIERSGFEHSFKNLFNDAAMILVPDGETDIKITDEIRRFFLSLGFSGIKVATPEEHDRIIAYTSQLAHVLSSAYIKSDAALSHMGFAAGSFKDMTRVATLHEGMWTELFLDNRDNLLKELDGLMERLARYKDALEKDDGGELLGLLKEGRERKALVNSREGVK